MKYRRRRAPKTKPPDEHDLLVRPQKAVLVGVLFPGLDRRVVEDHIEELGRLTQSAGARVVGEIVQERQRADAAFFIGRGKAKEVGVIAGENRADIVIFDDDLSPAQVRNLEQIMGVRVVDRSWLILEIFARRARS